MMIRITFCLVAVFSVLMLCGCRDSEQTGEARTTTPNVSPHANSLPTAKPTVEMWNGGIALAGMKPSLLFAVWEDGRVLIRRPFEPRTLPFREASLYLGTAEPDDIKLLLKKAADAGFFAPPIQGPVVYPDGTDFVIIVRNAEQQGKLEYHGGDPRLNEIGPEASPSRKQLEAFDKLWREVEGAIRDLPVADLSEPTGDIPSFER